MICKRYVHTHTHTHMIKRRRKERRNKPHNHFAFLSQIASILHNTYFIDEKFPCTFLESKLLSLPPVFFPLPGSGGDVSPLFFFFFSICFSLLSFSFLFLGGVGEWREFFALFEISTSSLFEKYSVEEEK